MGTKTDSGKFIEKIRRSKQGIVIVTFVALIFQTKDLSYMIRFKG